MSKQTLRITAVIFDMDGVITNTMPDHFKAWKKIFAQEGIHATHLEIYSREGQPGLDSVREMFTEYNKPYTLKKARKILKDKERLFKKIVKTRFIRGARRFLHDLHGRGFSLALVTGTSRHELHKILPDNIYDLFDVVVTGSDVRNGKPHPEPYRKAIKKLKVKRKDVIVFENAPFGIRSAKAAGLKCFALETSLKRPFLKQADAIFSTIKEFNKKVKLVYVP